MKRHLLKRLASCCPALAALVVSVALFLPQAHGQIVINSINSNGQITYNDPNGKELHYAVLWSYKVDGPWMTWQDAVSNLSGMGPSGTVNVPMFYRVVAPDPAYFTNASYTYYDKIPWFNPTTPLDSNEMRITFMGSMIPLPVRKAQAEMSVFVEMGWIPDTNDVVYHGRAVDQFIFDCGAGVSANYAAAMVGFRRMDKVFINHLHADHMNDLAHIYSFGPAGDRKSPLFVFGQSPSGVESPAGSKKYYNDGVSNFCAMARNAWRWHSESFSFQQTYYSNYHGPTMASWGLPHEPIPVSDDPTNDAYAMIPIELDYNKIGGVAYSNSATGAKVTHYPVIHTRKGSMGYKLDWTPPGTTNTLSMIYSSDTKPESNSVMLACNDGKGVDVFIHEMVIPPDMWTWKNMGLPGPPSTNDAIYPTYIEGVEELSRVQGSSHTPQGAYGYLLSQINPPPRLAVATHFPVADDTVKSAFNSVKAHCTNIVMGTNIIWSFDLLVLRVYPDRIEQKKIKYSDFSFNPPVQLPPGLGVPKYNTNGVGDPYAQIDTTYAIPATNQDGSTNYSSNGY